MHASRSLRYIFANIALLIAPAACEIDAAGTTVPDAATPDASVDAASTPLTPMAGSPPADMKASTSSEGAMVKAALPPGVHVFDKTALFRTAEFSVDPGQERFLCYATTLQQALLIDGYAHDTQKVVHHIVFSRATAPEPDGLSECDTLFRFTWDPLFLTGAGASEFSFPSGVGHELASGTQLVIQLHLLNSTGAVITDSVDIDMHRSTAEHPQPLAPFVFGSTNVNLPPKQTTTLQAQCVLNEDVQLVAAFPHMHLLGRSLKFEVERVGETGMHVVFERDPYEFDDQHADLFDLRLSAGDKTRLSCTYDNDHDEVVRFGESTLNEMCFLVGYAVGREGLSGCSFGRRSAPRTN